MFESPWLSLFFGLFSGASATILVMSLLQAKRSSSELEDQLEELEAELANWQMQAASMQDVVALMGNQLYQMAVIMKGEPPEGCGHTTSDLVELLRNSIEQPKEKVPT